MDIHHKLIKYFQIMASKLTIILVVILLVLSCKRADNAWNEVKIMNETNDTILLNFRRITGTEEGLIYEILPKENYRLANAIYTSDFGIIEDNWGKEGDTIQIFNHDTTVILAKWGAPLRYLPDSIHSFYNKNSWVITNGGRKDKYVIATFTITEADFKKNE